MATLDISIVNSALPTIQGEIGASGTEGTWITTAYLVAEIVIIPMAAWLERMFGLRTFLLIAASLFTAFSIMCGFSQTLLMLIIGRVGQGFTGGAMIPTAQTIIAQRLPARLQPIGLALFGVTAILGPVIGPLIGGWMTENVSWHYAFFLNLPICIALVTLLLIGLPHEKPQFGLIASADWVGIVGLTLGLGGLTVFLEDGQRDQWFDSPLIQSMAIVFVFGFALLIWGQLIARRPIINLRLLLDRQFAAVAALGGALGMVLYGTAYAIPQFLAGVANYNALQSGQVVMLSGIPSLILMALVPTMLRTIDVRVAVAAGFICMGLSALMEGDLTRFSSGADFTLSQLLRGVGQILGMLFLSQAVVTAVPVKYAGDASGLFNVMRNLGGSVALAVVSILQDQRSYFHSRRIEEALQVNSQSVQTYVTELGQRLSGNDAVALQATSRLIDVQSLVMTYNDIFWAMGVGTLVMLPLIILLRPLPKNAAARGLH